jgi:hypothetical protein
LEVVGSADPVPKLTVFELISSASDICNWNTLLEPLGTVGNPVSEVFSRVQARISIFGRVASRVWEEMPALVAPEGY